LAISFREQSKVEKEVSLRELKRDAHFFERRQHPVHVEGFRVDVSFDACARPAYELELAGRCKVQVGRRSPRALVEQERAAIAPCQHAIHRERARQISENVNVQTQPPEFAQALFELDLEEQHWPTCGLYPLGLANVNRCDNRRSLSSQADVSSVASGEVHQRALTQAQR